MSPYVTQAIMKKNILVIIFLLMIPLVVLSQSILEEHDQYLIDTQNKTLLAGEAQEFKVADCPLCPKENKLEISLRLAGNQFSVYARLGNARLHEQGTISLQKPAGFTGTIQMFDHDKADHEEAAHDKASNDKPDDNPSNAQPNNDKPNNDKPSNAQPDNDKLDNAQPDNDKPNNDKLGQFSVLFVTENQATITVKETLDKTFDKPACENLLLISSSRIFPIIKTNLGTENYKAVLLPFVESQRGLFYTLLKPGPVPQSY